MDPFAMGGIQAQLKAVQEEAARAEVEGSAGSGLVVVRMNGAQDVLAVHIDPRALADRELCEDLVRAATNDAVRRSREAQAEAMRSFAARLGLPPGLLGL
ncbi:MAG: YbaB/EbfC family nucleoid-associated protein [Deltaproteobacteria bacterium]|nr:YbaB/EbfC family nucleoid-associated protein [Deltaproteobacteria bacterium]